MDIENFPKGVTETEEEREAREAREQEDKAKDEVDETKIGTEEKAELTPEEKEEKEKLEEKREKALAFIDGAEEKLDQGAEKLLGEKREVFKEFAGKAKERLKAVGKFIKDYSSPGGLATATVGLAWVTKYFATCPELSGGNDIVLATMTGVFSGATAMGAFVEGVRTMYRRKEEKEGEE